MATTSFKWVCAMKSRFDENKTQKNLFNSKTIKCLCDVVGWGFTAYTVCDIEKVYGKKVTKNTIATATENCTYCNLDTVWVDAKIYTRDIRMHHNLKPRQMDSVPSSPMSE